MYRILVLVALLAKYGVQTLWKLWAATSGITEVYARIWKDKALFHTHKPLQILDREWWFGTCYQEFREVMPIVQGDSWRFEGLFGDT